VLVRLVFGVCLAILVGDGVLLSQDNSLEFEQALRKLMGESGRFKTGSAQGGITISTCLALRLQESEEAFRPVKVEFEILVQELTALVGVVDKLGSSEWQGLSGTMSGAYRGTTMGTCFGLVLAREEFPRAARDDVRGGKIGLTGALQSLLSAGGMELAELCEDGSSGLLALLVLLNLSFQRNDGRLVGTTGSSPTAV